MTDHRSDPTARVMPGPELSATPKGHVMRRTSSLLVLALALICTAGSGCYRHGYRVGPPPPAYACDSYGCDGYDAYGGYSECIDGGQYHSRRDPRRLRRNDRRFSHGSNGAYINGMPVMAAYIVPMGMDSGYGCGCMNGCMSSGDCYPCGNCGPYGGMPGMPCGPCDMGGCLIDGACQTYESGQPTPSSAAPNSGAGPQEGDWQRIPQAPQSFVEPAASRPIESSLLPAAF